MPWPKFSDFADPPPNTRWRDILTGIYRLCDIQDHPACASLSNSNPKRNSLWMKVWNTTTPATLSSLSNLPDLFVAFCVRMPARARCGLLSTVNELNTWQAISIRHNHSRYAIMGAMLLKQCYNTRTCHCCKEINLDEVGVVVYHF